ncbi:MAG: PD-(D/E)XK nuclease family protein [Planctomycetes bacterium]|nr:PD-(D/E)XK nuclease family protein [Planctomycetota bacterium]
MNPLHLNVSQVRVAASCPRIAYFDADHTRRKELKQPRVTRIWKPGVADAGLGSLFHQTVERFNGAAANRPEVTELLRRSESATEISQELLKLVYGEFVNHDRLFRAGGEQQKNFMEALRRYLDELADILAFGVNERMDLAEMLDLMFGDRRRRVDVTFEVGPEGEAIHITGVLDYVFFDWRSGRRRIIDYKLTPGDHPTNDLFQVSLYALMHNVQHRTEPDVGVLYLHPRREMVEKQWEQIHADRRSMYDFLASLLEWLRYDEQRKQQLKPPGEPQYCGVCPWDKVCVARLGPKHEGSRLSHWADAAAQPGAKPVEPATARQTPSESLQRAQYVDPAEELSPDAPMPETVEKTKPAAPVKVSLPADHLWIGRLEGKDETLVGFSKHVLPTHVTVVGAAGSGKTWLAKVIVEEAIRQRIPVIAVDPQGDLVQFLQQQDEGLFTGAEQDAYRQFRERVETRVWTPGSSHAIRLSLNPLRLADDQELAHITDPLRRSEELECILGTAAANLVSLAQASGDSDLQQTLILNILRGLSKEEGAARVSLPRVIQALREPAIAGIEDPDEFIGRPERDKLARKLNSLLRGVASNMFTGGVPLDVEVMRRPTADGKVPLNVIYLNALVNDDQKQFFVASLAAEVYRWMVTSSAGGGPQLLFYLDEARDYLPAGAGKPPAKVPLRRLFSQGRKFGVCCLICTQSPRSVEYEAFSNCSTKIIGRLESQQDVERVREWFSVDGRAPDWLPGRKGAAKGAFVARWPEMSAAVDGAVIRSRMLFSLHQSAWRPDRLEQEMADNPLRRHFLAQLRAGG